MDDANYNLLGKVLSGEADEDEKQQFDQWLSQSQKNKEIYAYYHDFFHNTTITEEKPKVGKSRPLYDEPKRSSKVYWAVAASVVLLLTFAWFLFDSLTPQMEGQVAENEIILKSNPNGQKSRILLPDGSTVWLNSNSKIEYAEKFSDSLREVRLVGEAYFEVTKDTQRPFVVETGDIKTTVLGTSFNISNYEEDDISLVTLLTGKIKVELDEQSAILQPGLQIEVSKQDNAFIQKNIDINKVAAWKDGILIFDQEDFHAVVKRLERWYGIEIVMKGNPSSDWKFTGYFDNEHLKNVLEALSFGKTLTYSIEGKKVELMRKH